MKGLVNAYKNTQQCLIFQKISMQSLIIKNKVFVIAELLASHNVSPENAIETIRSIRPRLVIHPKFK